MSSDSSWKRSASCGAGRVVVRTRVHGRARATGLELEARGAMLWVVRGGKIVSGKLFQSMDEALAADRRVARVSHPHLVLQRLEALRADAADLLAGPRRTGSRRAPCASRGSSAPSSGPMPSSWSSCSTVAVLRLIGPAAAPGAAGPLLRGRRGAAARHARGHDHLLPVRDLRRQVHALQVGPRASRRRRAGSPRRAAPTTGPGRRPGAAPPRSRARTPRRRPRRARP